MTRKLFILLLALCLALSMAAAASAVSFTDAHGNVIELDSTLEAYTDYALDGANHAARRAETNLGDLWTDALLWFAASGRISEYYDEDDIAAGNTGIQVDADHIVALWNGGNLREDVPAGRFTAETLAAVLPYPNKISVIYMTGAELLEALEVAAQGLPYTGDSAAACASFMQVAGMKYTVDATKAYDAGEAYGENWFKAASIARVTIEDVHGQPFDEAAMYAVITHNANFNGMDSSYKFAEAAAANDACTITTAVVRDVIWTYLSEVLENVVGSDYEKPQGRITVIL